MLEEKQKAEEEKRKQEAFEKERQALLEKTQREEQKKIEEEEAKRQAEIKQLGASKLEPVIPSTSDDNTNKKQTETLIDKGSAKNEGKIFKTTEEEERILKENERNRTVKKESVGRDKISHAQQLSVEDYSPVSNADPWLPMSPKTEIKASDRPSARTEREHRRQRCLMHEMLQNKHTSTSLVEAEKGEDGAKEPPQTSGRDEEVLVPQDEKSDKEKEVAKAKMADETNNDQDLGKPARPSNLQLNIQPASQKQLSEEKNKQNTPQDVDVPCVGIIQRYSDHEKLRNKAEKWKEKRQNDGSLTESASTPDRDDAHLRQDSKEMPPRFGFNHKVVTRAHHFLGIHKVPGFISSAYSMLNR